MPCEASAWAGTSRPTTPRPDPSTDVYRVGMQRELGEEIALDTPYTETCVGLINDDETPVGRVHLGVVHLFDVELPHVSPREPDMLEASFCRIEEILPELDRFESWSQIVVPALFG
jgi:predicted NUDIX family phosphoesterase